MPALSGGSTHARFGNFEVDLRAGELRRNSDKIKLGERALQVLAALLERPGEVVTREELQQKLWPANTFVDFEHSINTAVNKLREALGDSAERPRFIETLPRHGYRFIAPVETVAPPIGAVREPPLYKRWAVVAGAVLVGTLAVLFTLNVGGLRGRLRSHSAALPKIESIAVLPLENLSHDPEQEYFADGMTEELITNLGKSSGLRVISRTSVMRYKGTKKPLPEIAKELNVDAVVEGTVLRSGDRVRITANLLHAPTDRHLWANTFEGPARDVLTLQGDVARAIANEIEVKLKPGVEARLAAPRPVDIRAQDAYLKGLFFSYKSMKEEDLSKAMQYTEQALQIAPDYAPALALLASCYYDSSESRWGHLSDDEAAQKAKETAFRAIQLDNSLALPHVVLGAVYEGHDWDWAGAEREFRRAIEISPSSVQAHVGLAWHLTFVERPDEAILEINRAVELDPASVYTLSHQNWILYLTRRYDEAIDQARRWLESYPNTAEPYYRLARTFEAKGMYREEVAAMEKQFTLEGRSAAEVAALRRAYQSGGIRAVWLWDLMRLKDQEARGKANQYTQYNKVYLYSLLGEKDKAFELVDKMYASHGQGLFVLKMHPRCDNLRSDPRFQALLRRMNFPP